MYVRIHKVPRIAHGRCYPYSGTVSGERGQMHLQIEYNLYKSMRIYLYTYIQKPHPNHPPTTHITHHNFHLTPLHKISAIQNLSD